MGESLTKTKAKLLFPKRPSDSNKGTFGKVLNIAGCASYKGAAYLSSYSALKSGAGYVTLASVKSVCDAVTLNAPEVTFIELNENSSGMISSNNKIKNVDSFDVISAGCGISTEEETKDFLFSLFKQTKSEQKIIIDADGLNIIAKYSGERYLKNTLITPHPKELARILNTDVNEITENREKYARLTSQKFDCITLLKGHNTIITDGENIFTNTTGNSALAKAGTGDVLTGIIAGFAAQGLSLIDAAKLGAYIHGLSGDIASEDLTQYCICASDVIEYTSEAIKVCLYGE